MILIVTRANDTHADLVENHLATMGEVFRRIDTGWLPNRIQVTTELKHGNTLVLLHQDGTSVDITSPKSVWFRKPTEAQVGTETPQEVANFIQRECQCFWSYIWEAIRTTQWINHPQRNIRANNRILQWQTAQKIGFGVPNTMVTNSPASVLAVWKNRNSELAVKVLNQTVIEESGQMFSMYTKLLDAAMIEKIAHVEPCPIIVQPYRHHIPRMD